MNKEKNYRELQEAVKKFLGLGDALAEITFERILEAMPEDHSYEVYGFTKGKQENFTPSDQLLEEE
jgi:hypothetical protein